MHFGCIINNNSVETFAFKNCIVWLYITSAFLFCLLNHRFKDLDNPFNLDELHVSLTQNANTFSYKLLEYFTALVNYTFIQRHVDLNDEVDSSLCNNLVLCLQHNHPNQI